MYVTWWSASKRYTRVCANNWLPLEFESLCDVGARTCTTVKFWHQRQTVTQTLAQTSASEMNKRKQ
jgi:hypothetical protein